MAAFLSPAPLCGAGDVRVRQPCAASARCAAAPPPEHHNFPLLGAVLETRRWGPDRPLLLRERLGPVWRQKLFGQPMYVVSDLALARAVLVDAAQFKSKDAYPGIDRVFGKDAVVTLVDGEAHAKMRGRIGPAFSPQLFEAYCQPVLESSRNFWKSVSETTAPRPDGETGVKLDPLFRRLTFSTGVRLTSGITNEKTVAELEQKFLVLTAGLFLPNWFFGMAQKAVKARDEILEFLFVEMEQRLVEQAQKIEWLRAGGDAESMVSQSRREIERGEMDLFTILIAQSDMKLGVAVEDQKQASYGVGLNVILLWFAALETTSSALSASVFEMGRRPDLVHELAAEQDALAASLERPVAAGDVVRSMPKLQAFMSEVMRLHPPALSVFRRVGADDVELGGYRIPADAIVQVDLVAPGRDEAVFPDAGSIDITRYSSDAAGRDRAVLARASLLAFGDGPHTCIAGALAQQIGKTILSVLVSEYNFELDPAQSDKFSVLPSHAPLSKVPMTVCTPRTRIGLAQPDQEATVKA